MQRQIEIEFFKKPSLEQRRHFNSFAEVAFQNDKDFRMWLYENFEIFSILDPTLSEEEVLLATEMIKKKAEIDA